MNVMSTTYAHKPTFAASQPSRTVQHPISDEVMFGKSRKRQALAATGGALGLLALASGRADAAPPSSPPVPTAAVVVACKSVQQGGPGSQLAQRVVADFLRQQGRTDLDVSSYCANVDTSAANTRKSVREIIAGILQGWRGRA